MTLSTKQVFGVFCFQEQKAVLENTKQTGPKFQMGKKRKMRMKKFEADLYCKRSSENVG